MLWISKQVFDTLSLLNREAISTTITSFRSAFNQALEAKQSEIDALKKNHEDAVTFLKSELKRLQNQIVYERSRADDAVNKLLVRDAKVWPLNPSALQGHEKEEKDLFREVDKVFSEMNMAGEDDETRIGQQPEQVVVSALPTAEK